MYIYIQADSAQTAYAAGELRYFLETYTNSMIASYIDEADRVITLHIDTSMPAHHYRIHGDGKNAVICGGNASSVLCGVCDALAAAGIFFEANGHSAPKGFDQDVIFGINREVKPKFRQRGIRQHINFTMDISSYPLWEAQEYIRNLARMRYNAITFHSYPGQWHEADPGKPDEYAGHFFYGQVHPVPAGDPLIAGRINNRKYYCIPEAEEIFEDEKARGEYAKYWLNEVMKTAKEAGMALTLSVEILKDDEEVNAGMLTNLCKTYPLIDTLELITEECGGFRDMPELTLENIPEFLTGLFGKDILDEDGKVPGLPDFVPGQLGSSAISLKRVLRMLEIRDTWLKGLEHIPALRGGIYLTCADTLRILRPVLRRYLPEGMTMSLLPAHGALAAADNVENTGTTSEDWQNTMFYSWAEFDGNMYVQQMSTDGIEKLTAMSQAESCYGFCINHWRTEENTLAISYAAEAGISVMPAKDFYIEYARKIGIANEEEFIKVSTKLAWLDTYNRDNLFNVGFCAVVCWLNWCRRGDVMLPRGLSVEALNVSMAAYEEIGQMYKGLLNHAQTERAIAYVRLMINRCQTSILHMRALLALENIADVYDYDHPTPLSSEQSEKIGALLRTARDCARDYMHLYGEIRPDRGTEGQIVSYDVTIPVFIEAVAANFNNEKAVTFDTYDAPPMPDEQAK